MKTIITNVAYLLIGLVIGYLTTYYDRCSKTHTEDTITTEIIDTVPDTVVYRVKVEVPKYKIKYVNVTDSVYITVIDSIEKWTNVYIPDTTNIQLNEYIDSVKTSEYRFDYVIDTWGHLVKFDPKITVYENRPIFIKTEKPNWMISGAVSNNATVKLGLGYRGITVEGEIGRKIKQLYIGKQFLF